PLCAEGRPIGLLEADDHTGAFTDRSALATASLVAAQAAEAVQRFRLRSAAAQARELRREAQLAQEASSALLPARSAVPGLEALGWTRPAFAGGSDSFDYWPLADGRLALFLGDASGHGLASGLIISEVRALLHVLCDVRPQPEWLLERINARLQQDREPRRFVTAFFGCLSPEGELRWCSAGQGPLYWRPDAEGEYLPLPSQGPPLGVDPAVTLASGPRLQLSPGGRVAVLSDGILDADNGTGRLLGPQRLKTIFDNTGELPLAKVVELLREVVTTWQGGEEAADDQSALIAGVSLPC
ncbi:MAG TPA: PP2C family protein-serine/threonine phosphatase, partial [Vicinamibacteria bacterium]|nr:PP2C family protein-serine/threonine phosphatase [Vicinamibacteria bacterium]